MYILFDIGGTKMRLAASRDCKEFVGEPTVVETPDDFDEAMEVFRATAQKVCHGEQIESGAGGIAGVFDIDKATLLRSPNNPKWIGKPLREKLSDAVGAPIHIDNDTAIVGLGEAHFGAGKGAEIVAYMTVSTGVGGARIVDGRIDANRFGFEPGHQIIDFDGTVCPSCNAPGVHGDGPGHLEGYVSGTATQRRFGVKPYEIEQEDELWQTLAEWLAVGLNNTIVHWSPDIVVLGGSMIVGDPGIKIADVRRALSEKLDIFPLKPEIKAAELEDFGGLYGAMVLADQKRGHA